MKTTVKLTLAAGILSLSTLSTSQAQAQACPPNVSDFATWGWTQGAASGDNWMTGIVCASVATRNAAKDLVVAHLGLDENWDYWEDIVPQIANCNPDTWAGRLVNGGYAAELVGIARDNDTFGHFASPGGILPGGAPVKFWLSQYVSLYVSDEGYDWQCLASMDAAGGGDGYTFASNPFDNSACSLYFPWFWNKTVTDRASTLVHEATHEFSPHLGNSACTNGASCDDVFMNANAQSFQIIFDAQSLDAYQREPGSRELKVVNYGNSVCGYLALLPDAERFSQVQVMQSKLGNVFQTTPSQSSWPASAFIDTVVGSIYDLSAQPNGQAGQAYRIDITNQAMWPCGQVCNVADFTFVPNGASGARACNESYQAGNVQRNAANRARCNDLNAQVNQGVTPAERSNLLAQAANAMQGCIQGVSDAYVAQVCVDAFNGALHVDDIEANWSLPDDIGYNYTAEESIRACQAEFCQGQPLGQWNEDAFAMCFEWDDPAGCMELSCGDLSAIEADKGRESFEYLAALVCRASELGRNIEGLEDAEGICDRVFNECWIREQYLPLWQEQLAGSEECWSESVQNLSDPFRKDQRRQIGLVDPRDFLISDRGVGLLRSACTIEEAECEALQAALEALQARIAGMKFEERPFWKGPPLPDNWEDMVGRFDRELVASMAEIGVELTNEVPGPELTMLSRDTRLMRAANRPEARIGLAEFVGQDLLLGAGGARFSEGVFSPEAIATFGGANAQVDPYGLSREGFEGEIAALQTVGQRQETRDWQALLSNAGQLGGDVYYGHMVALLQARNGQDLQTAHDALQAELQALQR